MNKIFNNLFVFAYLLIIQFLQDLLCVKIFAPLPGLRLLFLFHCTCFLKIVDLLPNSPCLFAVFKLL